MNITAKEIGRSLVLTIGAPTDDMSPEDRKHAEETAVRFVVPPVTAEQGTRIWAHYASILFLQTDATPEATAVEMTRIAFGAYWDETSTPAQRAAAEAQWDRVQELRWAEGEQVTQMALYWNAQGGGIEIVEAMLRDGHPKAQELLMTNNQIWNAYSRLRMLPTSTNGDEENETRSPDDSIRTTTRNGFSEPVERDAFGIKRIA